MNAKLENCNFYFEAVICQSLFLDGEGDKGSWEAGYCYSIGVTSWLIFRLFDT